MSNFQRLTLNPKTNKLEEAEWLDDHFGHRQYGIKFPDGTIIKEEDLFKQKKVGDKI